jgi:predicted membrane-bound dolichyl-phosphate-mannose-protein mannosyltransferase
MAYVCVFGLVAAVALIQLIRSLLVKCDMTYWKIIHTMVFLEGFCTQYAFYVCCFVRSSTVLYSFHDAALTPMRPASFL